MVPVFTDLTTAVTTSLAVHVHATLPFLSWGRNSCLVQPRWARILLTIFTTLLPSLELAPRGRGEQVLAQQPTLFRRFKVLRQLLSQEVCPLILQTLR